MTWTSVIRKGVVRAAVAAVLALPAAAMAGDWYQFLGPTGNGVSTETGLMKKFPEGGPKVLWTVDLGPGYGGAAVKDGKVYVLDRVNQEKDILRCLDMADGKEQWTFSYAAPGGISHDGSRSTPAVTDKFVYTVGPFGHLHCVDLKTHEVVWKKNLLSDYGGRKPNWAVAQSPMLYKDMVLAMPLSNTVGIVAYDQATGQEKWKSKPVGKMAYASALVVTIGGVEQVVVTTPEGAAAVSAADGSVLWTYAHRCQIPVPNVTAIGDDSLFVTGGYNAGSAIIKITKTGDKWEAKETSKNDRVGGHCHPALLVKEHLYMLCNTNERADGMVCFDKSCKIVWQTNRSPYLCKGGSILTGDGLIYLVDGEKGDLHIIEPSPEGFKSLDKVNLLGGKEIWGSLTLANGKLIIRDQKQMKCVDIKAQ